MEIISALGYCSVCNRQMIRVGDITKCLRCEGSKQVSTGQTVQTEDPGSEELNKMLKAQHIIIKDDIPKVVVEKLTVGNTIQDALKIMKNLPIPDDIKQFKQVKKVITLLEKITSKE